MEKSGRDLRTILRTKINVADLVDSLTFSDEETSEAARDQPSLFLQAAVFRVSKMRKRQRYVAKLKLLHSTLSKRTRERLREIGQRVTDKEIESIVARKQDLVDLQHQLDSAEQEEEYSKYLLEAYRMRSSSIKALVELVGAEVYVARRNEGGDTELEKIRRKLKEKYPGKVSKEERRRSS